MCGGGDVGVQQIDRTGQFTREAISLYVILNLCLCLAAFGTPHAR